MDTKATEDLKPYLDSYNKSSERSRGTFFLIVISTIVIITTFLNTRHGGWIDARLRTTAAAYAALAPTSSLIPGQPTPTAQQKSDAVKALEQRGVETRDQLKSRMENLEKTYAEAQMVKIPIVGVTFDVNDMGMVAGASLFFLSLMLLYASTRERDNLVMTLARARYGNCLPEAYRLLSMAEVLHSPPKLGVDLKPARVDMPILLLLVPVLAQSVVTGYDFATTDYGNILSAGWTNAVLLIESGFLGLLVAMAIMSRRVLLATREIWAAAKVEVEEHLGLRATILAQAVVSVTAAKEQSIHVGTGPDD